MAVPRVVPIACDPAYRTGTIGHYADREGENDWAERYPDRLDFSEPWDGQYDT